MGPGLLQLILVLVLLDREQKIALFGKRPVLVMLLLQIPLDACNEFDRVYRRRVAGHLDGIGDALNARFHHRYRRRWLRRELRLNGARGGALPEAPGLCRNRVIEKSRRDPSEAVAASDTDDARQSDGQMRPATPGE
jgi:hypothetical protein